MFSGCAICISKSIVEESLAVIYFIAQVPGKISPCANKLTVAKKKIRSRNADLQTLLSPEKNILLLTVEIVW